MTGVHRAGASLNVHIHFHVLCLDGVYRGDGDALHFERAPAPTREELTSMLQHIYGRVTKWLSRRGLLREADDADASNETRELSPTEALAAAGMARGTIVLAREGGALAEETTSAPPPRETDAAVYERFNLHASQRLAAHDDLGRERLCRYLTRPAFSLARLQRRRDGNVVYRVKKAGRGRVKERVMTPVECLARLAAITPPPRYPLLRLHGVLAPRHRWRPRIVPRPPLPIAACKAATAKNAKTVSTPPSQSRAPATGDGLAAFAAFDVVPTATLTASGRAVQLAPNVLSIAHWERLRGGELYAPLSRVDWATLLRRTFDVDVRVCPRCGGRLRIRAVITAHFGHRDHTNRRIAITRFAAWRSERSDVSLGLS